MLLAAFPSSSNISSRASPRNKISAPVVSSTLSLSLSAMAIPFVLLLLAISNFAQGNVLQRRHGLKIDALNVKYATGPNITVPPVFTFSMPIDHFNASDNRTYNNRYWLNDTYYKPGGPVFFYDAGMSTEAPRCTGRLSTRG